MAIAHPLVRHARVSEEGQAVIGEEHDQGRADGAGEPDRDLAPGVNRCQRIVGIDQHRHHRPGEDGAQALVAAQHERKALGRVGPLGLGDGHDRQAASPGLGQAVGPGSPGEGAPKRERCAGILPEDREGGNGAELRHGGVASLSRHWAR